ncbi:hypothetical protein D3C76_1825850 [compost metagenome]
MQQLRTLTAEHRLALWVIDDQYVTLLVAIPLEGRSGSQRFEEALEWVILHVVNLLELLCL